MSQPSERDLAIQWANAIIATDDAIKYNPKLHQIGRGDVALAREFLAQQKRIERLEAVIETIEATWCSKDWTCKTGQKIKQTLSELDKDAT